MNNEFGAADAIPAEKRRDQSTENTGSRTQLASGSQTVGKPCSTNSLTNTIGAPWWRWKADTRERRAGLGGDAAGKPEPTPKRYRHGKTAARVAHAARAGLRTSGYWKGGNSIARRVRRWNQCAEVGHLGYNF